MEQKLKSFNTIRKGIESGNMNKRKKKVRQNERVYLSGSRETKLNNIMGCRCSLTSIDDACYSPDPLTQFLNRKAYYKSINEK